MFRRNAIALLAGLLASTCGIAPAHADDVRAGQWYLDALGITKAQSITRGLGVTVAVIDSGVDGSVPDMRGAVVGGADFSGKGSANGQQSVNSDHHGTNVASLIAARGSGSAGVIGVAPQARLLSASVDIGARTNTSQVVQAIRWSVDHDASIINMSLATIGESDSVIAAVRYAQEKNVIIVTSSGNDGGAKGGGLPCGLAGVVCVGGVDKNLQHDPDANTDPKLTIAGPYATEPGANDTANPRLGLPVVEPGFATSNYAGRSGTSLAAPVVAGTLALIKSKFPDLDAANVVNRLIRTATPAGGSTPNATYGYGIVNAERALTADVPTVTKNPLGSLAPARATSPARSDASGAESSPVRSKAADDDGSNVGLIVGIVGIVVAVIAVVIVVAVVVARRAAARPGR